VVIVDENLPRPWNAARRLLCIRLDSLGDVLMTTPALRALRSLPGVEHITLLTSSGGAEVARLVGEADEVWSVDVAWLKHTPTRTSPAHDLELIDRIRRANFDASVIFTVLTQNPLPSAMACYLAGVPLRLAHCRENPYQLLTDWVIDRETPHACRHEVARQLDLVRHVGATTSNDRLSIRIGAQARASVAARLRACGLSASEQWCVLHPGATAQSRRYSPDAYAKVAGRLEQLGFRMLVTGSRDEAEIVERVVAGSRAACGLVGHLDVEKLAALIAQAPLLITNNTGPAHLAAAAGTPVVDLYALTNSQHTPWHVPQRVLNFDVPCRNCLKSICPEGHHDCLSRVDPEEVVQAVLDLWHETRFNRPSHRACANPATKHSAAQPNANAWLQSVPLPNETPSETENDVYLGN
jgi:lipopolysaccharide heptosyltransferase II